MKKSVFCLAAVLLCGVSPAQYNWSPTGGTNGYVVDFGKAPNGDLYATAHINMNYKALLYKSTDNGVTWTEITTVNYPREDYPHAITVAGGNLLIAGSTVSLSTDGGDVFTASDTGLPTSFEPNDLLTMPDGVVYVCGAEYNTDFEPRLYRSTDGGSNWTQLNISGIPLPNTISDIINVNNKLVITTDSWGGEEGIFVSSDGGVSWTASSSAPAKGQFYRATALARGNAGELYVVGDHLSPGTLPLYVSTDQGMNWIPVNHSGLTNFFFGGGFIKTNGPFIMSGQIAPGPDNYVIGKSEYAVGVEEMSSGNLTGLYPNPAQDKLKVLFPGGVTAGHVSVLDALGKLVIAHEASDGTLDVSTLPEGVYSVHLSSTGGTVISQKLLISR